MTHSEQLNWLGMPHHPTDTFLHWSDSKDRAEVWRKGYKLLTHNDESLEKLFMAMLQMAFVAGERTEHDAHADVE